MKKVRLIVLGTAVLTLSLASCGEKKMTPEELAKKVDEQFTAQKAKLQMEADESCAARFDNIFEVKRDSIVSARMAEMEAAAPAKGK